MSADPPRAQSTRFQKGTSGNPGGRPKKLRDPRPSAFDIVIERTLTISQGGSPREVSVDEALQHKTYQDAIAGNRPARREVLKWIAKREKAISAKAPRAKPIERIFERVDPSNADTAMRILGIACKDPRRSGPDWTKPCEPEHILLEPWAVQAALSRRTDGLTARQIDEAKRSTLNPGAVRWPDAADD